MQQHFDSSFSMGFGARQSQEYQPAYMYGSFNDQTTRQDRLPRSFNNMGYVANFSAEPSLEFAPFSTNMDFSRYQSNQPSQVQPSYFTNMDFSGNQITQPIEECASCYLPIDGCACHLMLPSQSPELLTMTERIEKAARMYNEPAQLAIDTPSPPSPLFGNNLSSFDNSGNSMNLGGQSQGYHHLARNARGRPAYKDLEKKHKCNIDGCAQAFPTVKDLKRHYSVHGEVPMYICTIDGCIKAANEKPYNRRDNFIRHMKTQHKEVAAKANFNVEKYLVL